MLDFAGDVRAERGRRASKHLVCARITAVAPQHIVRAVAHAPEQVLQRRACVASHALLGVRAHAAPDARPAARALAAVRTERAPVTLRAAPPLAAVCTDAGAAARPAAPLLAPVHAAGADARHPLVASMRWATRTAPLRFLGTCAQKADVDDGLSRGGVRTARLAGAPRSVTTAH